MTNEIKALIAEALNGSMSELKSAIIEALKEEVADAVKDATPAPTPRKHGFRKGGKIDYTPTENEVNVCEYSDKQIAVWGDLKGKTELLDIIKTNGTATVDKREMRATFIRSLASIGTDDNHPCGWLLMKEALNANGLKDALFLATKLTEAGSHVVMRESVKDITDARKAERKDAKKAEAPKTPKADAPKTPKADKPKADAPKPAPAPKASKVVNGCMCYEPAKNDEQFAVKERDLTSRGKWFFLQGDKGAFIYINAGVDAETNENIYALITKVKGDVLKSVAPDASVWDQIADAGIVKAVEDNILTPTVALMNAVSRYGTEEDIDVLWNRLSA